MRLNAATDKKVAVLLLAPGAQVIDVTDVRRVGVVADTHDEIVDWDSIHSDVARALDGVDLIVHCGDLTTTRVLDRLEEIAPVVAVRSEGDPPPAPPRLVEGPLDFTARGHHIQVRATMADEVRAEVATRGPAVLLFGGTHVAELTHNGNILFLNPGSPSLAQQRSVGVLELHRNPPVARIVEL